jgi:hypothetical protein
MSATDTTEPELTAETGAAVTEPIPVARPGARPLGPTITRIVAGGVIIAAMAAAIIVAPHEQSKFEAVQTDPAAPAAVVGHPAAPGAAAPSKAPAAPAPGSGPAPSASTPLGGGTSPGAAPVAPGAPLAVTGTGPAGQAPTTVALGGTDWRATTKCSYGWPSPGPDQQGGLSSLISVAPAAGPFMSEAFALGSVYQPIMSLAGPLLAEVQPVIAANMSWISPLIDRAQAVGAVVLQAILPFYGPYRQQFLSAEGALAAQLTPILQNWASSDVAVCFVAWEAQQIRNAKGAPLRTVSLTQPWTTLNYDGTHVTRRPLAR